MEVVFQKLGSSQKGLTQAEAQKRLAQYGPNEIEETKTNPFLKFLLYFWGPIPWMIEAAVILSGVVRHWPDFFIIFALLLANAMVGFWEEREVGNAIEALKAKLAVKARVIRDGKWINPAVRELAGVDVLCADKTGALILNKLSLGDPFRVNDVPADQVILYGALASRADNDDTIDLAVLAALKDQGLLKPYEIVHFQPFDPVHKRTESTVKPYSADRHTSV
jgi:magnesium-transporting ATPase (P-type)